MKTILILTDFSYSARNGADLGLQIASALNANIVLLNATLKPIAIAVTNDTPQPQTTYATDGRIALAQEADRLLLLNKRQTDPEKPVHVGQFYLEGSLQMALQTIIKELDILMVITGNGQQSSEDLYSVGHIPIIKNIVKCPLLIMPDTDAALPAIKSIAFTTDLAKSDLKALAWVKKLAAALKSQLFIGHISKPGFNLDGLEEISLGYFMEGLHHLNIPISEFQNYYAEDTAHAIQNFTDDKHADLLVMVHKHHTMLWRWFHSGVTTVIQNHQQIPLLLIPEGMVFMFGR